MDKYDCLSPADYRYWDQEVAEYMSENGFTRAKLKVEAVLASTLSDRGVCSPGVATEIAKACQDVTAAEVYAEEARIGHDIRALVNCIQAKVSDEAKPFVHMTATSYDIVDTANAARFKDATHQVVVPRLKQLLAVLITLARREAGTVQIGRTHGQHAVPITFGFAIAGFAERLGNSIIRLEQLADELVGKFSGAVGAYNASRLMIEDSLEFERQIMQAMDLQPAFHSTQIAPPEPMMRLLSELVVAQGVMANLARDMRNLQRTEISEVGEEFGDQQVGSSTMPQKRNPINFENAESLWKELVGRLATIYFDQVSEHQRDLTGSASGRTNAEIIGYVVATAKRLTRTMKKLSVDQANLQRNLRQTQGAILAEPLYILLAKYGHRDAHEKVRQLTLTAKELGQTLTEVAGKDPELKKYFARLTGYEQALRLMPARYTGLAAERALAVADKWAAYLADNAEAPSDPVKPQPLAGPGRPSVERQRRQGGRI